MPRGQVLDSCIQELDFLGVSLVSDSKVRDLDTIDGNILLQGCEAGYHSVIQLSKDVVQVGKNVIVRMVWCEHDNHPCKRTTLLYHHNHAF